MRIFASQPARHPRPARRLRLAAASLALITAGVTVAGCTGASSSSASSSSGAAAAGGSGSAGGLAGAAGAPGASGAVAGSSSAGSSSAGGSAADLSAGGHQLIETAQLTVRAASVSGAVSAATSIVAASGGYVSAESAKAAQGTSQPGATVTFKIPQTAYPATLATLSGGRLGTQLSLARQAQDVTQQVADTSSRVASAEAAIAQLRALLKRAGSVSALLSVQNQISAQESSLEALQAQQRSLSGETSYATVSLTLVGPKAAVVPPPSSAPPGLVSGLAGGWHAFRLTISWLLAVLGAVAPFVVVIAVVGGLAWWVWRRRRNQPRPASE